MVDFEKPPTSLKLLSVLKKFLEEKKSSFLIGLLAIDIADWANLKKISLPTPRRKERKQNSKKLFTQTKEASLLKRNFFDNDD